MRAFEIFFFMVCVVVAFGIVNSIGIFPTDYVTPDSGLTSGMTADSISQQLETMKDPSILDYFLMAAQWLAQSFVFIISMVGRVAFFATFLYGTFHVPLALAVGLNVGLYVVVIIGVAQYMSGRPIDQMR